MTRPFLWSSILLLSAAKNHAGAFQSTCPTGIALNNGPKSLRNPFQRSEVKHATGSLKAGPSFSRLSSVTNDGDNLSSSNVDVVALAKYGSSIVIQMSLIFALFTGLDLAVSSTGVSVPFGVLFVLFYALSLKSRVFNPLNNARPDMEKAIEKKQSGGFQDRNMPSWTPPGVVFPIVWLLINAPLRAYASSLVYQATGHFADPAILAFCFHLSVGDVWNTINNTEKRYGASVSAVIGVWATAAYAALQYYQVVPLAGKLLGGTVIWLTIASTLVAATWRINPDPATGKVDALYPVAGEAATEFAWFGGDDSNEQPST